MFSIDALVREFHRLPEPGTPAHKLTNRDKLAIAMAAGVPTHLEFEGTTCRLVSDVAFEVLDSGDGAWLVVQGPKDRPCTK